QWLADLQNRRDRLAAAAYPDCLEELRRVLLETMDTWLATINLPVFIIIDLSEIEDASPSDILQLATGIADSMDALMYVTELLDEQGIQYDDGTTGLDGEGDLSRYRQGSTARCPAVRWVLTGYLSLAALLIRSSNMMNNVETQPPGDDEIKTLIFDIQKERQRVDVVDYPECVSLQRQSLMDTGRELVTMLQAFFDTGYTYETAIKANNFLADLHYLQSAVSKIDTMDIVEVNN
ncbi:MAG TPA: hypothetical protein VHL11_17660, partial [Phototrophicaceae bacterium]|nr:hypothetical protein [Phototrophicaceae bacterium]